VFTRNIWYLTDAPTVFSGSGNAPPTRTALDKVVDYVLGEGPNSRYALICKHCYAHNGLVLPDDLARARTFTNIKTMMISMHD
jgi:hypothetical protein